MTIVLDSEVGARYPRGFVVDADMSIIGDANSYTYGGAAFAVHTPAFAGYVPFDECEFYRKDAAGYYPSEVR